MGIWLSSKVCTESTLSRSEIFYSVWWRLVVLLLCFFPFLVEAKPDYAKAESEFALAWNKLYPLPYEKIVKRDPLQKGVQLEKRKDQKTVFIYNFTLFMPKYELQDEKPVALAEGREITAFFLWDPKESENPYRIRLGELELKP